MELDARQQSVLDSVAERERAGKGGVLFLKCGFGKTWVASMLCRTRPVPLPTLIVCQKTTMMHWCETVRACHRDAEKPPNLFVLDSCRIAPALEAYTFEGSIIMTTFKIATTLFADGESFPAWGRVIIDEAHELKNPRTVRHKAFKQVAGRAVRGHVWLLTATPVQNCVGDILSLASLLGVSDAVDVPLFISQYVVVAPDEEEDEEQGGAADPDPDPAELDVRKQMIELPEASWEAELYERVHAAFEGTLASSRLLHLEAALRCMQVATHPRLYFASMLNKPKIPDLEGLVRDIERARGYRSAKVGFLVDDIRHRCAPRDSGVIVFCDWKEEIKLVAEELAASGVTKRYVLDGSMTLEEREDAMRMFKNSVDDHELDCSVALSMGDPPPPPCVLIVQIRCGSQGINLQHSASRMYMMRPPYNPTTEYQAICRLYRRGQTRPVTVVQLICSGTIDEHCFSMQSSKLDVISDTLNDLTISGVMRSAKHVAGSALEGRRGLERASTGGASAGAPRDGGRDGSKDSEAADAL